VRAKEGIVTAVVTKPDAVCPVDPFAITDEQLRALTADERRSLARRLAQVAGEAVQFAGDAAQGAAHEAAQAVFPRRRWFLAGAVLVCGSLTAWIVLLSRTLPSRYVVGHWDAAWVGFDVILLLSMAAVGSCVWWLPRAVPVAALVTAVLLVCDAWFDVSTSAGTDDMTSSVVLAAGLELPLAAGMAYLALRRYRRRHR